MPRSRSPHCLTVLLAIVTSGACAGAPHPGPLPAAGSQLTRVAEVPTTGGAGGAPFADACAARLRDPATGREYLIVHSSVRTATASGGTATTTTLQAAVGDYALVDAAVGAGAPVARIRVDCPTSRVIEQLPPGT